MMSWRVSSALPARIILLSVALWCFVWGAPLRACPTTDVYEERDPYENDPEELFREGRRLLQQKRYADACQKFAESHRIEPSGGTILHLGICHQGAGKPMLAWLTLHEALEFARCDEREDRAKKAQEAINDIEAQFPRLILDVAQDTARLRGAGIAIDGVSIKADYWRRGVPVAPGDHTITAVAPGRQTMLFKATAHSAAAVTIRIPSLPATARKGAPFRPAR